MASGPLLSWDIFMEFYHQRNALAKDASYLEKLQRKNKWTLRWDPRQILLQQGKVIIVTDPLLHIIFVSSNLPELNGYSVNDVIGKSPELFHGAATSEEDKRAFRAAIDNQSAFKGHIVNYRKSSSMYKCQIEIMPAFGINGRLANFIVLEKALYE